MKIENKKKEALVCTIFCHFCASCFQILPEISLLKTLFVASSGNNQLSSSSDQHLILHSKFYIKFFSPPLSLSLYFCAWLNNFVFVIISLFPRGDVGVSGLIKKALNFKTGKSLKLSDGQKLYHHSQVQKNLDQNGFCSNLACRRSR